MKPSDLDWLNFGVDSWSDWWEWYGPILPAVVIFVFSVLLISSVLVFSFAFSDTGTMNKAIRRAKSTLVLLDRLDCEQELKERAPDFTYIPPTERAREPRPRVGDE